MPDGDRAKLVALCTQFGVTIATGRVDMFPSYHASCSLVTTPLRPSRPAEAATTPGCNSSMFLSCSPM